MKKLNLPAFDATIKQEDGQNKILDVVRRRYVALTPEEWVRQHVIHYFHYFLGVPYTLMAVEKGFRVGQLQKRFDVAVYTRAGKAVMLVECKAPGVPIKQEVFDQIARYNLEMQVDYLFLTNGMTHYGGRMDYHNQTFRFIENLPEYAQMTEEHNA